MTCQPPTLGPRGLRRIALAGLALAALSGAPGHAAEGSGDTQRALLEGPPLSVDPVALSKLVSAARPAALDVEVLLDEESLEFAADGRLTRRSRLVYRVLTPQGVDGWDSVSRTYWPWYQSRPEVRARVIAPEGSVQELDPATLVDAPAEGENGEYTDRRRVSAPLPAVRQGSVIETWTTIQDQRSYFEAGQVFREWLAPVTYTQTLRVRATYPKTLPLRFAMRGSTLRPRESGGPMRSVIFTATDVLPLASYPPAPPDVAIAPVASFSTGASWAAIAQAYAREVDAQLAGFDPAPILAMLIQPEDDRRARIARALRYVRDQVRYTAYELGNRSLIPVTPGEVLDRKYGDCKDKATLLVGLLRGLGMEAHVALLETGPGLDVDPDLPGMGRFDHAIVHVGGAEPIWIDATSDYAELGRLPAGDEDRLSLIAAPNTRALVRTPASSAEENRYLESVRVEFQDLGKARITESTQAWGEPAHKLRASSDAPKEALLQKWKEYAKERYAATLRDVTAQEIRDPSGPMQLRLDLTDSASYPANDAGAEVEVVPSNILSWLPELLLDDPNDAKEAPDPRYRAPDSFPLYIQTPHDVRIEYLLQAPEGFVWDDLPEPLDLSGQGVQMTRALERISDREVAVRFRVRSDARRIGVEQVAPLGELVRRYNERASVNVRFVHSASRAIERGELSSGLALHRSLMERAAGAPAPALRYARELMTLGFGISARRVVEGVLAQHPDHAPAHAAAGWLARFDDLGREGLPGSDLAKARASYRRAVELTPDKHDYEVELARLLMHAPTARGFVEFGAGAPLEEAVRLLRKLHDGADHESHGADLVRLLTRQGEFEEAIKLAASLQDPKGASAEWIAAVAATKGAPDAERLASRIAPDTVAEKLREAALELAAGRRYAEAAALANLDLSRRSTEWNPILRETLNFAKDQEGCRAQMHPAAREVVGWIGRHVSGIAAPEPEPELKPGSRQYVSDEDRLKFFARTLSERAPHPPLPVVLDSSWCRSRARVDELGAWARVRVSTESVAPLTFFLRRERKDYRLVGMEIPTESYAVVLSLRALMAKQYEESHALLRWAHEDYQPKGEFLKRIKALFRADLSARERPELDVAIAASAAVTGRLDAREIAHAEQILSAASAVEPLDPERKTALSYARARLLLNESPEQAARAFGALYEASSEDEELWTQYAGSLLVARRFDELVPILKRRVQGRPDRDPTWQGLTFAEVESGQFAAALERVQSRRSVGVATDTELNKVAWASLFVSGDLALAAELAGAALQIRESSKGDGVKAILNTLAVLRAEVGDYAEAHGFFLRSIEGNRSPKLGPADWYALGRIAEGLGLGADAEAAYARIPEPKPNASFDVWTLAETRRRRAGL